MPAPTTTPRSICWPTQPDHRQVFASAERRDHGEVEYAILWQAGIAYVTVGSDHTDRVLENFSVAKSKQACPNMIPQQVWLYDEVKEHWDQIQLKCWVTKDGKRSLYQDATLAALMSLEDWKPILKKLGIENLNNSVFFSGTVNTVGKQLVYADTYELEMTDPVLNAPCATNTEWASWLRGSSSAPASAVRASAPKRPFPSHEHAIGCRRRRIGQGRRTMHTEPEAAVAIVRTRGQDESILFIRRTEREDDSWSGHWSFPGGRRDPEDPDPLHTALRELEEECGIRLGREQMEAALPVVIARRKTGPYLPVAPFVFAVEPTAHRPRSA